MEKNNDVFNIELYGVEHEVKLEYASYNCNGTLALQMFCKPDEEELAFCEQFGRMKDDPFQVPYGIATVNLPESEMLGLSEQFVDENNLPGIGKWLQDNGIAKPTGVKAFSGYCCYEAYRFNVPEQALEKIRNMRAEMSALPPREEQARGHAQRR